MLFTKRTYEASDLRARRHEIGSWPTFVLKSGRGQPHSKTLARIPARNSIREVLECGCPLPLFRSTLHATALNFALVHRATSCGQCGLCFRVEAGLVR